MQPIHGSHTCLWEENDTGRFQHPQPVIDRNNIGATGRESVHCIEGVISTLPTVGEHDQTVLAIQPGHDETKT